MMIYEEWKCSCMFSQNYIDMCGWLYAAATYPPGAHCIADRISFYLFTSTFYFTFCVAEV